MIIKNNKKARNDNHIQQHQVYQDYLICSERTFWEVTTVWVFYLSLLCDSRLLQSIADEREVLEKNINDSFDKTSILELKELS